MQSRPVAYPHRHRLARPFHRGELQAPEVRISRAPGDYRPHERSTVVHEAGEDHRRDPKRAQLPMDTELLTPQEAAVYLRLNPQTAYRLLQTGRLPGVKIG